MNHRERVLKTLEHKEPDRVPIDLGSTVNSGKFKKNSFLYKEVRLNYV